jgi:two-component system response regulator AtoC
MTPGDSSAAAALLVVDDEENMRHMLASMLKRAGYAVETAGDGEQALARLREKTFDFVLCDIKMPKMDGMAFLSAARKAFGEVSVIMMSAYGTIDLAVEAMKLGAYDFISKPFKNDEVRLVLQKAQERDRLKRENELLRQQLKQFQTRHRFGDLVAHSGAMQAVFEVAAKVAPFTTTILITGESGTGKELMARAIHQVSPRRPRPLVPVNCASIPGALLESELFGYARGAFTGADQAKQGVFAEADGGTIFLDEIGELPPPLQVKLLRVLQESEIRPLGCSRSRSVDVRILAATSRDLARMIQRGAFREDLYYRLNVVHIEMPPLRERSEDLPLLCQHFIDRFNQRLGSRVQGITPAAMQRLARYRWPGNVRELENAIERAMVLTDAEWLTEKSFTPNVVEDAIASAASPGPHTLSIKNAQKTLEKELIVKALHATGGNRTQAARLLEISHPSLLSKMKQYAIDL